MTLAAGTRLDTFEIIAPLEARPETGFLAVLGIITPLFLTHDFRERDFLDGLLVLLCYKVDSPFAI